MKLTLLFLTLFTSLPALAQVAAAPSGASNISAPPVGGSRTSSCGKKGCFEIKIQPFCFGTNLRSYSADIQLRADEDVKIAMKIGGSSGDDVSVRFPARITYGGDGSSEACTGVTSSTAQGQKDFVCNVNGVNLTYRTNFKANKNSACYGNAASKGQEYCDYAARNLPAQLISGAHPDAAINCLYTFDSTWKVKNEIKCFFPSQLPDESANVVVSVGGQQVSVPVEAYTNNIIAKIPLSQLNWVNSNSQLTQGKRILPKNNEVLPAPAARFFQITNGSDRELEKSGYQLPDKIVAHDETNNNMSLSIVAKFPGEEGFCGGFYSPLMLFFDKDLPKFNGISLFPLEGVKDGGRVNWPEADSKGYFLAQLAEGEKDITKASQLFGQDGKNQNGFESLKLHDSDKNNQIDSKDKIWKSLRLWRDANSNGYSEADEIHGLSSKGVESISLAYTSRGQMKFGDRARVREKSTFKFKKKGKVQTAEILDVWFSPLD
jgi:hypothetical protein